ncbi:hypothetical protein [Legionella micdadei]|uniref:Putative phage protein n=1 Tax=Legionella micdadei TaxID=451 RepID=A0A098GG25_LEGMI|nr:hypothetical protein [Legionella micdadei]KTD27574.1 hypothetical protein Lmic_1894 [Legionella micdadei]CEG60937.1 Putative phage protein [Legionella micdadei]SCY69205.1 hypothetical protein SAMN02982997_02508 [Legionella micdadei]
MLADWLTTRNKKRAPITPTAWNKIKKELWKCEQQGINPVDSFETMVASGWQSLRFEWFQFTKPQSSSGINNLSTDWGKNFYENELGF